MIFHLSLTIAKWENVTYLDNQLENVVIIMIIVN